MKVALCFKGQPRSFDKEICYNSFFEKIISPLKADVYMHTYWDKDQIGQFYGTASYIKTRYKIEENLEEKIKKIYNPKKLLIKKPLEIPLKKPFIEDKRFKKDVFISTKFCWYSMKKVLESIEEKYDWYIITRTDLEIKEFPSFGRNQNIFDEIDKTFVSKAWLEKYKYLFYDVLYLVPYSHLNAFKNLSDDYNHLYKVRRNMHEAIKKISQGVPMVGGLWNWAGGEYIIPFQFQYYGILDKIIKTNKIRPVIVR